MSDNKYNPTAPHKLTLTSLANGGTLRVMMRDGDGNEMTRREFKNQRALCKLARRKANKQEGTLK